MRTETRARVMTIYIGEQDHWHKAPLYAAIVARLREIGIAGVTVPHGIQGYGAHRQIHTQRIEVLFQDLPVVIEAVDTPEKIEAALPLLEEMVVEGLVTIHDVEAIRYEPESPQ
jgi:PII-like signaling protein